jgi:ubiquinone/menaquinone biosynthesis methyltransferase
VIPPLLNDAIGLMKDTALISFLGPVEAFRRSQIVASSSFNFTPYLVSAMLFLILTIPMARLADGSWDAATIAFGIRNVEDPRAACRELARVLRPGGRVAILEFGMPRTPIVSHVYRAYFRLVVPRIGRLISGHGDAYEYLPVSVVGFPYGEAFAGLLREAGFRDVCATAMTFGTVYLYTGVRA